MDGRDKVLCMSEALEVFILYAEQEELFFLGKCECLAWILRGILLQKRKSEQ